MSHPDLKDQLNQSSWLFTPPGAARKKFEPHDFAGYGSYNVRHTPRMSEMDRVSAALEQEEKHYQRCSLGQLEATAISGNDILSSTFYVSGLVTLSAGVMAPLCLLLVAAVLYLFRGIYHETVMALPCNGGTYNILLNCTSKQVASMAAVFAIIAYITTGVVSALEAVAYLETVVAPYYDIDKQWATILLLAFFCILTNLGMKESAIFAKVIFVMHLATLTLLTLLGSFHVLFHSQELLNNWSVGTPSFPEVNMAGKMVPGTVWTALFFGFSSASKSNVFAPLVIYIRDISEIILTTFAFLMQCWGSVVLKLHRSLSKNKPPGYSPRLCATCGWESSSLIRYSVSFPFRPCHWTKSWSIMTPSWPERPKWWVIGSKIR